MPKIKRILFPVDFSESNIAIAPYVEAVASQFEAEILLLHAVSMGEHNLAEDLLWGRKAKLDKFLAGDLGHCVTHRVCDTGDASSAITKTANAWGPDLIMMPTHGLGYFRRHLLGSVTAKTLHDLKCPVWTSGHTKLAPPLSEIRFRKILCSVDLAESSRSVLEWAGWLAGEFGATLGIVHAIPAVYAATVGWGIKEEINRQASAEARARIDALQATATRAAQVFIRPGDPESVVADTARSFDADLLVMGRHGGVGIAGAVLQNAYAILRESPCPVVSI